MIISPIHEYNDCHLPAGSSQGGQFCSRSGRGPLTAVAYEKGSVRIPEYLKADVARAARAGITTYHAQQPEPVRDAAGQIIDPLAKSHARRGEHLVFDAVTGLRSRPQTGRVFLMTRGGEFEPMRPVYSGGFPAGYEPKPLKPEMLTDQATEEDVISTYRHEIGHLMDRRFEGAKSTPMVLAREIRAWTWAVEASPDHRVSEKWLRQGLESHGYFEFRRQTFVEEGRTFKIPSWDLDEWSANRVTMELRNNIMDEAALTKAKAFADRVVKSLRNYGNVLRRKGVGPRDPQALPPWLPVPTITAGPGSGRFL